MEKRVWEKLGIKTSLLGFGCMRFPTDQDGKIDEEKSIKMLDAAYENGVNYYDTAYMYHDGESERFLGKWLDQHDRDSYFLTTKLPVMSIHSLDQAKEIFEEQRKKLNKEYFDFYLLHALNKERFQECKELGIIDYCEELKKKGLIRHLGFSFHDSYEAFEEILNYRDWDVCQIQLNYMDTQIQAGIKGYQLAEKKKIPMVIMEPVKGGSLANLPDNITEEFRSIHPENSNSSWAYRWVGSLPNVKVVLSGMSAMEHVEDNINTFRDFKPLTEQEQAAVERVALKIRQRVRNGCTGCRYCMPCPAGVDIPRNFSVWNTYAMYQNERDLDWGWKNGIKEEEKAKNCKRCGKCESACPQKLSIRDNLATLQQELDALI